MKFDLNPICDGLKKLFGGLNIGPIIIGNRGPVIIVPLNNKKDISKVDKEVNQSISLQVSETENQASTNLWLHCLKSHEGGERIDIGQYFSCILNEKPFCFWLGTVISDNQPETGLYFWTTVSELQKVSKQKSLCGIEPENGEYFVPIKEEQNMKNALKEIENFVNTGDKDGIDSVVEKIRDMVR
jgi:hypothetical protein